MTEVWPSLGGENSGAVNDDAKDGDLECFLACGDVNRSIARNLFDGMFLICYLASLMNEVLWCSWMRVSLQGDAPLGKSEVENHLYDGHLDCVETCGVFDLMFEQHKELFSLTVAAPIGWRLIKAMIYYSAIALVVGGKSSTVNDDVRDGALECLLVWGIVNRSIDGMFCRCYWVSLVNEVLFSSLGFSAFGTKTEKDIVGEVNPSGSMDMGVVKDVDTAYVSFEFLIIGYEDLMTRNWRMLIILLMIEGVSVFPSDLQEILYFHGVFSKGLIASKLKDAWRLT